MVFEKAVKFSEIAVGEKRAIIIQGKQILLINNGGNMYCIENICSHRSLGLESGHVENSEIECPFHQARFNIKTGKATKGPAIVDVKTFPVKIEEGYIYVDI